MIVNVREAEYIINMEEVFGCGFCNCHGIYFDAGEGIEILLGKFDPT